MKNFREKQDFLQKSNKSPIFALTFGHTSIYHSEVNIVFLGVVFLFLNFPANYSTFSCIIQIFCIPLSRNSIRRKI